MHILYKIVARKKEEVEIAKRNYSISSLENNSFFKREVISAKQNIRRPELSGVIAEFKRRSPSKPTINLTAKVSEIIPQYTTAKASALSVLTDAHFFGGHTDDLLTARDHSDLPILRKDFIIDEYQLIESKAHGADLILLIARILDPSTLSSFTQTARDLGLEVLVEIHNEDELKKITTLPDIVGINNRDLDTFQVDYTRSKRLLEQLPTEVCKISESGITDEKVMLDLFHAGFEGFLIGERFMASDDPGESCQRFISNYLSLKAES